MMFSMPSPKLALLTFALLGSLAVPALAQAVPFDMTPESDRVVPIAPSAPVEPATPAATPAAPATATPAVTTPAAPTTPVVAPATVATGFTRPILPAADFQLEGEEDRRAVTVYLTQAQADSPASLELGYLNAIVAAPEASNLRIVVNGTEVLVSRIESPSTSKALQASLPAGLLKAGPNVIEFLASQRHRTDCTVASTFELWTRLDPATSLIRFEGTGLDRVTQLSELAAIGFAANGATTVRLIIPGLEQPAIASAAMLMVQQVALALRVPELDIELLDDVPAETPVGTLNIVMAVASELPAGVAVMQGPASAGPLAAMLPANAGSGNTLVISGPDWGSTTVAIGSVQDATPATPAGMLPQRVDLAYPIPIITGAQSLALSDLGVNTVEFNGRRYRTSFEFALPADFYANMYGQAELVLDAAYSSAVEPGSEIDIYANGQIASATPVLRTDGGLFRDTRIKIPMTNFRPGRNQIEVEVILLTEADALCAAGLTQDAASRFLFSASTNISLPDFARASALPDLLAFAGTGAPYDKGIPVPMLLAAGEQVSVSALTWLARMAVASGTVVPVQVANESALDPAANALLVAPFGGLSDNLLGRSGISRNASGSSDDGAILDQFNQTVGSSPTNPLDIARNWVADQVGLAPENFWILQRRDAAYLPKSTDAVILAQTMQPEGGVWTYLTIPDETGMADSVRRLTQTDNWRAISGRVSTLGPADPNVRTVKAVARSIVQTQPFSISNIRMVVANWLSTNVLEFTALLAAVAILLMLITGLLLRSLGRHQ